MPVLIELPVSDRLHLAARPEGLHIDDQAVIVEGEYVDDVDRELVRSDCCDRTKRDRAEVGDSADWSCYLQVERIAYLVGHSEELHDVITADVRGLIYGVGNNGIIGEEFTDGLGITPTMGGRV